MRGAINAVALALILLFAVGLVLPLIQKTREAATRTQCGNNLKQIALSMHNYNDTYGYFPPAAMANPLLPPEKRIGWPLQQLPFVESDNIFAQVDKDKGWDAEENRWAALMSIKVYLCPGFPSQRPTSILVPSHYIGIAGIGADAARLPADEARVGAFGYEPRWMIGKSENPTSTLIIVAETTRVAEAWTSGGWPTARGLEDDGPPLIGSGGQFGGIHKGGAMVAFADGSAGIIATGDAKRFKAMATLHGGEGLEPPPEE